MCQPFAWHGRTQRHVRAPQHKTGQHGCDRLRCVIEEQEEEVTYEFPRLRYGRPLPQQFVLCYLRLERKLEEAEQRLWKFERREKVIELRDISREQAKEEIRQLFQSGRTLYYSDIAEELGLELEVVVDICKKLQENGEIAIDES